MANILGEKIHEARKAAGLSLAALAAKAGTSAGYLSEIENGRKKPGSELLFALTKVIDLKIDAFANIKGTGGGVEDLTQLQRILLETISPLSELEQVELIARVKNEIEAKK